MKKTLFAFMALATAYAVTSCQSEEELPQQPTDPQTDRLMVINAVAEGIGTGTRAEMKYKYDIVWSESDEIYVAGNSKNATFTLTGGAGTTNGTFACQSSSFTSGEEVEAYYPASLVDNGNLVWPAEQTSNTVVPMYSKNKIVGTGTENFSFASLGAVLQIVFNTKQENVTLKSITLKDDTNPLSGTFTVNEDGKAVMTANADAPGITYDLGETGKALGDGANYFNIAVPACTYSNLSITFMAADDSKCTLNGSVTINHNTVGRLILTGKEFKKFGQGRAFAKAPDCKVTWIQLWENGPKFAEYNIGATSATDYGGYYTWGGTYANGEGITWTDDHIKGTSNLSCTGDNITDTATKLWGENWRMPTREELEALVNDKNCTCTWTTQNSVAGLLCTGKEGTAYASNSVFLPPAGRCVKNKASGSVRDQGKEGGYWSSTPYDSNNAYPLTFWSSGQLVEEYCARLFALSVRAVLNEE